MSIGTILVIILVLILLGGIGAPYINAGWQPGYCYGWYGNGGIGLVLLIIIILLFAGRLG